MVESTPSAIALARADVGAAILPAAMNATVATGLVEIALVEPVIYRSIALVRRQHETLSPAATALYVMIKSALSASRTRKSAKDLN